MVIRKDLVKRIHVSQKNLRANRKDGGMRPLFTIQLSSGPVYANSIDIKGPSKLIHSAKPLSCGAVIWIETRAEVWYDEISYLATPTKIGPRIFFLNEKHEL